MFTIIFNYVTQRPPDLQWRNREKWIDKEHHELLHTVYVTIYMFTYRIIYIYVLYIYYKEVIIYIICIYYIHHIYIYIYIYNTSIYSSVAEKIFRNTNFKSLSWLRYLDDIICIWTEGLERLQEFYQNLNSFIHQLTLQWSFQKRKETFWM